MPRTVDQQRVVDEWKADVERLAEDPLLDRLTEKDQQQRLAGIAAEHPGIESILQIGTVEEDTKGQ